MRRSHDITGLVVAVVGTEAIGALSGVAAGGDFVRFYDALRKPPAPRRRQSFGPAWTILYLLMGVAVWLVWREGITRRTALALGLFAAQLALNFAWSLIFFGQQRIGAALHRDRRAVARHPGHDRRVLAGASRGRCAAASIPRLGELRRLPQRRHLEAQLMESVWDYPRPPRVEASRRLVRVEFAGEVIAETTRAFRVLETSHPPVYYIPPEDVRGEFLRSSRRHTFCEFKGEASYYDLVAGAGEVRDAAWYYPSPPRASR